ncbi:hypothetical protein [[Limnothrix rosea] IAM M-220]|nr:hypothetical protein [[Limnothrix rosea] IAM M-220]OKH19426.1 hypothetical protein NIES208_02630 [[Limnothrix rosea] IAM M-220]
MKTQSIAFLALFCLGVDPIQTSAQIIPDSVYSSPAVNQHDECQTALRNVKEKVSNAGGFVDQLYFSNDFQYHNQP